MRDRGIEPSVELTGSVANLRVFNKSQVDYCIPVEFWIRPQLNIESFHVLENGAAKDFLGTRNNDRNLMESDDIIRLASGEELVGRVDLGRYFDVNWDNHVFVEYWAPFVECEYSQVESENQ
jgi:hypothetical protein